MRLAQANPVYCGGSLGQWLAAPMAPKITSRLIFQTEDVEAAQSQIEIAEDAMGGCYEKVKMLLEDQRVCIEEQEGAIAGTQRLIEANKSMPERREFYEQRLNSLTDGLVKLELSMTELTLIRDKLLEAGRSMGKIQDTLAFKPVAYVPTVSELHEPAWHEP